MFKARLKNNSLAVAVKTCKVTMPDEQKKKFLQEGRILKQYEHPNIVRWCPKDDNTPYQVITLILQVYRNLCAKAANNDCDGACSWRLSFELPALKC